MRPLKYISIIVRFNYSSCFSRSVMGAYMIVETGSYSTSGFKAHLISDVYQRSASSCTMSFYFNMNSNNNQVKIFQQRHLDLKISVRPYSANVVGLNMNFLSVIICIVSCCVMSFAQGYQYRNSACPKED